MVHVLLRGVSATAGNSFAIGGATIAVLGAASREHWQGVELLDGDLDAATWVQESAVTEHLNALRRDPRVVDAMTDACDRNTTRRRPKIEL
jgi:hypothetical protein